MPKKELENCVKKSEYQTPQLIFYGAVQDLTQTGTGKSSESKGKVAPSCVPDAFSKPCSERRVKENITRIGDHPLGIGLYLFDYKPEYNELFGHGRHFGVMIDEVECVMPRAIWQHPDGFKRVDYTMLGINRVAH